MAKNRHTQSGAVRFVGALKAILLCMIIGGSAVGFVLQKNKLLDLSKQIGQREAYLDKLKWHNKVLASQLADAVSPLKLAERVKEKKLDLFPAQPWQTIWLAEPTVAKATPQPPGVSLLAVRNP